MGRCVHEGGVHEEVCMGKCVHEGGVHEVCMR